MQLSIAFICLFFIRLICIHLSIWLRQSVEMNFQDSSQIRCFNHRSNFLLCALLSPIVLTLLLDNDHVREFWVALVCFCERSYSKNLRQLKPALTAESRNHFMCAVQTYVENAHVMSVTESVRLLTLRKEFTVQGSANKLDLGFLPSDYYA